MKELIKLISTCRWTPSQSMGNFWMLAREKYKCRMIKGVFYILHYVLTIKSYVLVIAGRSIVPLIDDVGLSVWRNSMWACPTNHVEGEIPCCGSCTRQGIGHSQISSNPLSANYHLSLTWDIWSHLSILFPLYNIVLSLLFSCIRSSPYHHICTISLVILLWHC